MAAAFFNKLADPAKARAISAGTTPGERVYPEVVAVMEEEGIDLSAARPQKLTTTLAGAAQLLITMGCGDECPYVPGIRRDDWPLEDPKGQPIERVRAIRDDLRARVEALITQEAARQVTSVPDAPRSHPNERRGRSRARLTGAEQKGTDEPRVVTPTGVGGPQMKI